VNVKPQAAIALYPNPVINELKVISGDSYGTVTIKIYNIQGKIVQQMKETATNRMYSINVSALPVGIYILSLTTEAGEVARERFIKQ